MCREHGRTGIQFYVEFVCKNEMGIAVKLKENRKEDEEKEEISRKIQYKLKIHLCVHCTRYTSIQHSF